MFKKFLKTVYVVLAVPTGVAAFTSFVAFDQAPAWYVRLLSGLVALTLLPIVVLFYIFMNVPGIEKYLDV